MSFSWPDRAGVPVGVQTVRVTVCDLCGSDEPTEKYSVGFPTGSRRSFDLCGECDEPFRKLEGLLGAARIGRLGPKKHQQPVLTPEEVAKRQRAVKRKPRNTSA